MERSLTGYAVATLVVLLAYAFVAGARKARVGSWSWNMLVITQGVHPRASVSKLQLFFFTLVVLWVVTAALVWTGELVGLSDDVVVLLGIAAAGTVGGKITAMAKGRLSFENWAWLIRKGWIRESLEPESSSRKPEFGDLLRSGGEFDVSKFQLLAFSGVIGVALIYFAAYGEDVGDLSNFNIPGAYLSLIGLSQAVYVGGKAVGPATKGELGTKLNEVRSLETVFVTAVDRAWAASDPVGGRNLGTARAAAPEAYRAYRLRAEEAATMVGACIGGAVGEASMEPSIPGQDQNQPH